MLAALRNREILPTRSNNRGFYASIWPDKTLYSLRNPSVAEILKFSPCGRFLVCLGKNLHSVAVYAYSEPCILPEDSTANFLDFFQPVYDKLLTVANEVFCKDFCLFTENKNYLILASSKRSDDWLTAIDFESSFGTNLENLPSVDDVTIWVIEVATGIVVAKHLFKNDFIYLSNASGVCLFHDLLAITSVFYQKVHLLRISSKGGLIQEPCIASFHDPELDHSFCKSPFDFTGGLFLPTSSNVQISGLKQQLLSFLYRKAQRDSNLSYFYLTAGIFESLRLCRMQFIDCESLVMLKLVSEKCIIENSPDSISSYTCFFVFYELESSQVLQIYDSSSEEFLSLFETYDALKPASPFDHAIPYGPANNKYVLDSIRSQISQISQARLGNLSLAVKRFLSHLPLNPQTVSQSPYYDPNLYLYDPRVVSSSEGSKQTSVCAFKFYCRKTGKFKFELDVNPSPSEMRQLTPTEFHAFRTLKKSVRFVFHPILPICISIQKADLSPVNINLHTYSA